MKQNIFSLEGKVTIVTGGHQGIGKTVAGYLADAGSDIVIFDMQDATEAAEEIAKEYGVRTKAYVCDVTKPEQVAEAVKAAAEYMGTLDFLFNNAGICQHKAAIECTPQEWKKVVDVNLNGIYFMATEFVRYLIANNKKGNIVNTASMSGTIVNVPQQQASYNSSKAGVKHLTKSLAVEWAPYGIRVNSISPGYIRTELFDSCGVSEDWIKFWEDSIPMNRLGSPTELAGAVIYLLSDAATYTTGCDMLIDGGFTVV